MATATVDDVQGRLERPLTDEEKSVVPQILDDAEALIVNRIPDVLTSITTNTQLKANLVRVESYAAIRVLRNPEGLNSEAEGAYNYTYNAAVASGRLSIQEDEWALLGASQGAYSFAPKIGGQVARYWWNEPPWNFQYGPGL